MVMQKPHTLLLLTLISTLSLGGCLQTGIKVGGGGTVLSGSSGSSGETTEPGSSLLRCAVPLGVVALVEDEQPFLLRMGLPSAVPLVRLMISQSECFRVADRGAAMTRIRQERALARGGVTSGGKPTSSLVGADYFLTPTVVVEDADVGGFAGGVGSLLSGIAGAVIEGMKLKQLESVVMLSVTDAKTSLQEFIA